MEVVTRTSSGLQVPHGGLRLQIVKTNAEEVCHCEDNLDGRYFCMLPQSWTTVQGLFEFTLIADEEEFVPLYPTPHAPFETEILMLKEFKEKGVRVGKHERQMIQKFIEGIVELDLTKAETLMLINLRPSGKKKRAIVKAIVESSAERFADEEELDELLYCVKQYLL